MKTASPSDDELREKLAGPMRVLQIIVVSLAMGVSTFLGWVVVQGPPVPAARVNALGLSMTTIALGFAAAAVAARLVVPAIFVSKARRRIAEGRQPMASSPASVPLHALGNAGQLFGVYQTRTIIGGAILEGAAFFLAIAYMQERQETALASALVLIGAILAHFPTSSRVVAWIDDQLRRLEDERRMQ